MSSCLLSKIYTRATQCVSQLFITDCLFSNTMEQYLHLLHLSIALCNLLLYTKLIGTTNEMKHQIANVKKDITGIKKDITGIKKDIIRVQKDITGMKKEIAQKYNITGIQNDITQNLNELENRISGQFNDLKHQIEDVKQGMKGELEYFKKILLQIDRNCNKLSKALNIPIKTASMANN